MPHNLSFNIYEDIIRCGMSANEITLTFKSQIVKVNHYRSNDGLQHWALAHTEQQDIKCKGPENGMCTVKPIKRENERFNLYKKMSNNYEPHQQTVKHCRKYIIYL